MSDRILIVVTSHDRYDNQQDKTGYWLEEITHFWHIVSEAGYEVDFVSPQGGKPPMDHRSGSENDVINQAFLGDKVMMEKFNNMPTPDEIDPADYVAIYYAGGHGTLWDFPQDSKLAQIAAAIYMQGGTVTAVCHGVAGLLSITLPDGRQLIDSQPVTGFSTLEERIIRKKDKVPYLLEDELKAQGADYHKALLPYMPYVQVGERLLTGQNPQSTKKLAEAFVKHMRS